MGDIFADPRHGRQLPHSVLHRRAAHFARIEFMITALIKNATFWR
jgi:hypothetical protein